MSLFPPELPHELSPDVTVDSGRRRAILPLALVTAFLLVLGVVGAFIVNGTDASTGVASGDVSQLGPPEQAVPSALAAVGTIGSARYQLDADVDATYEGKRTTASLHATGAFDQVARRATLQETSSLPNTPPGQSSNVDVVLDGTTAYVSGDALAGKLPPGKTAVKITLPPSAAGAPGAGGVLPAADAGRLLTALQGAARTYTEVGPETIRGVETMHERVQVDLAAVAGALQADPRLGQAFGRIPRLPVSVLQPVDIWIDGDGHIRRVQVDVDIDKLLSGLGPALRADGPSGSATVTLDLFDLGQPVTVQVPPAEQVVEPSAVPGLGAGIGAGFGAIHTR